jgi:hypothetical protein
MSIKGCNAEARDDIAREPRGWWTYLFSINNFPLFREIKG